MERKERSQRRKYSFTPISVFWLIQQIMYYIHCCYQTWFDLMHGKIQPFRDLETDSWCRMQRLNVIFISTNSIMANGAKTTSLSLLLLKSVSSNKLLFNYLCLWVILFLIEQSINIQYNGTLQAINHIEPAISQLNRYAVCLQWSLRI